MRVRRLTRELRQAAMESNKSLRQSREPINRSFVSFSVQVACAQNAGLLIRIVAK